MNVVCDAVEQGAGEALAGEDRSPFLEGQVGGDDGGGAKMRNLWTFVGCGEGRASVRGAENVRQGRNGGGS